MAPSPTAASSICPHASPNPTLREAIEAGALQKLSATGARHAPDHALDAVTWLPPIPSPEKDHLHRRQTTRTAMPNTRTGRTRQNIPACSCATPALLSATTRRWCARAASNQLDYEGELVIVIGKAGRHIAENAALGPHCRGYAVQ